MVIGVDSRLRESRLPDVRVEPAAEADLTERRKMFMTMLDAVRIDTVEEKV